MDARFRGHDINVGEKMIIQLYFVMILSLAMVCGYGCGIKKPRLYVVDRPRVDQANTGNAGYLKNEEKDAPEIAGRPTRKIYVLEFEKKKQPEAGVQKSGNAATVAANEEAASSPGLSQVQVDEVATSGLGVTASGANVTEYTVEKDDTLQKIAKKVYGSYGKWTKIYDANKDIIKNPNVLRQGMKIVVPAGE